MSKPLRNKLVRELTKKGVSRSKWEQILKSYFDNGELRVEKRDWEALMHNGLVQINPGFTTRNMSDIDWKDIILFVTGRVRNTPHLKWDMNKTKKTITTSFFILYYNRTAAGAKANTDIERSAQTQLKEAMEDYFVSGRFAGLAKKVIIPSKDQEYEHGAEESKDFGSAGLYPGRGRNKSKTAPYGMPGRGIREKVRGTIKSNVTGTGVVPPQQNVPGAQGTLIDKKFIVLLAKELKGMFSTQPWFSSAFNAISGKWQDLFGYNTSLKAGDDPSKVSSIVTLQGVVRPKKITAARGSNLNTFDIAIQKEIEEFLRDDQYFMQEIMRLDSSLSQKAADDLTTDSPKASKRVEAAAIALAAAGILDQVNKKYIRKSSNAKKAKKNWSPQKKTSNTKNKDRGKFKTKTTTKRAGIALATAKQSSRGNSGATANTPGASPLALKELINAALPEEILDRMGPPALTNRTGRFRRSAQVTNVLVGPRGGVEAEYTYMRDPYSTFEPGGKMGSTYRDPRKIIGESVREIATKLTGNKFIKVRRI